jgi:nitrile hydratase
MTRVHDMGGRFGDGAVLPESQGIPDMGPEWQARALAITLATGALGELNIDISRHARERLSPKDYTRFTYYEKWVAALADLLVETGLLTRDDLQSGDDLAPEPLVERALRHPKVAEVLAKGAPADRVGGPTERFAVGQAVRTRRPAGNRLCPGGHTRLPTYASGARGTILRLHGTHVLPDSSAHRLGDAPEPLYAVAFPARQLWAFPEHPDDEVILDLWQSYLEPA